MDFAYKALWILFVYGFLGWSTEVIYAAVRKNKFVNRGFLKGPICPIYGFGILIVVTLLEPFRDNFLLLYIASFFLTSILELITGYVMETLFHQKWWDYSKVAFNIRGYVCLKFSLLWGLACVVVVRLLYPITENIVKWIPVVAGWVIVSIFLVIFILDVVLTVVKVNAFNKALAQLEEVGENLRLLSDKIGLNLAENAIAASQFKERKQGELKFKYDELKVREKELMTKLSGEHKRLLTAFPNLKSKKHFALLEKVKTRVESYREKNNK